MHIEIEWDADKAVANFKKHGVRFEEAATALLDPQALAQEDVESEGEARWVLIGMSASARLLAVDLGSRRCASRAARRRTAL